MLRRKTGPDWGEQDVFTGWRRMYCYTQRAGVCHKVKRRARRRERREGKDVIRRALD